MALAMQPADLPRSDVFVARQPIFDSSAKVYGYELLYRSGLENRFGAVDGELASLSVLSNSAFVFGLENLAGNGMAFVNFTRSLLVNGYARVLPPDRLVVEVLESIEVDDEVRKACESLKSEGYLIALDDFDPKGPTKSLVDLADIVKIDFMAFPKRLERQRVAYPLQRRGITLLAEKVETAEDARQARQLGYTYTQGYFFAKPEISVGSRSSGLKPYRLQMLRALNESDPDLRQIEELLRHDPALSYQILRYLNSAAFGLRSKVSSIRQAIMMLGQAGLRTWATVVILADAGSDKPLELIVSSVVRGRFCELAGQAIGLGARRQELSMLGLFSLIDVIVGRSLEETVKAVELPTDVAGALLGEPGEFGTLLRLVQAYERADWEAVERLVDEAGLPPLDVPEMYMEAVAWGNRGHHLG